MAGRLARVRNNRALWFVVLIGLVSLLADTTYEGARSVIGPYLGVLGATGAAVGFIAGAGELSGYVLRLFSGVLADRTQRYWTITIVGYCVNLLAVPALALAGNWPLAGALIVTERLGKGLRTPARDAMLSHAAKDLGRGWAFGIHEAMDQVGGMLGPIIVAIVLFVRNAYEPAFALLAIPAVLAISVLLIARHEYPRPRELEPVAQAVQTKGFPRAYWLYLAAIACVAAGFADFAIIAFHFGQTGIFSAELIPILYAVAMGVDGLAALVFGRMFDRVGFLSLVLGFGVAIVFAPLVFLGGFAYAVLGMIFWGIGLGAQESIMRAAVAEMVPPDRRGSAYGVFNTGYGIAWFAGSTVMGFLYDASLVSVVIFSVAIQVVSLPILLQLWRSKAGRAAAPS